MCEGASRDQLLEEARCHVIHHGWFLQGVLPEPGRKGGGWVYTVGLLQNFGHPELIVTDIEYEVGGALLNELGEKVRSGIDLRTLPADFLGLAHIRQVHPDHFDHDLVNTYFDLQRRSPDPGDYLQVVPANAYCECCRDKITDLSDPSQLPEGPKLNRAQRRAAQRRRRR